MYCTKCGTRLTEEAAFCPDCGAARADRGAGTSGGGGGTFAPSGVIGKVLAWIKANKRKALIAAAVIVVLIILANLGGGLSGTYVSEDGDSEIKFRGSTLVMREIGPYGGGAYRGSYEKSDDGYVLFFEVTHGPSGGAYIETVYAVKAGRRLLVNFGGSERVYRKK